MGNYFDIYMNQLFVTLGQLSAVVISSTVVVPVYMYYSRVNLRNEFSKVVSDIDKSSKSVDKKE